MDRAAIRSRAAAVSGLLQRLEAGSTVTNFPEGTTHEGEVPTYGVFLGDRECFANRVVAVAYDTRSHLPVGFTAMVYLPYREGRKTKPLIHLGLTMIAKDHRGKRLQTPLFQRVFMPAMVNQRTTRFRVTNIAASPAGIGATSDYLLDMYPNYRGHVARKPYHLAIAQQTLAHQRHEFGCSERAVFDPETFVVQGSNEPEGGGAFQFIKTDPVSRYRVEACNTFCRAVLEFERGDELFQVGEVDLIRGLWKSRRKSRATSA